MRPPRKVPNDDEDDSPEDLLLQRIGSDLLICKLAGIAFDRYEQWRDSIPNEYYYYLCEKVSDEDFQKLLVRLI